MRLGVAAAVVGDTVVAGDIEIQDGRIEGVGLNPAGNLGLALPGFIDVHVHGHAGVDFVDATVDQHVEISKALPATGVTAYHPTLMSMPMDQLTTAMSRHPGARTGGATPLGFHLEGPFLSPEKPGAHRPDVLLEPRAGALQQLIQAGFAHITMAPELPGGLGAVSTLVSRGVVVSLGHSVATAEQTHAAIDLGATAFTHVFNAMEPLGHRKPGMVGVALARDDVYPTAIFDGVHLSAEAALVLIATAGNRLVAITDGTAAINAPPGPIVLGDSQVEIVDGAPRLPDGTIAGSILTMDVAFRNLVDLGLDLPAASRATSKAPAELARLEDVGELRKGLKADITILDDELGVVRTLVAGAEVYAA